MVVWSAERKQAITASQDRIVTFLEGTSAEQGARFGDINSVLQLEGHDDDINRAALWYLIDYGIVALGSRLLIERGPYWAYRWQRDSDTSFWMGTER